METICRPYLSVSELECVISNMDVTQQKLAQHCKAILLQFKKEESMEAAKICHVNNG